MKKTLLLSLILVAGVTMLLNSCSGCVKNTTKKITEVSMSAVEGVVEAVDEQGGKLAEKTTDAMGGIAIGVGRSLDKQLDAHAAKVASVASRTMVQSVEGLVDGIDNELKSHYENMASTSNLCDGVKLDYIAKYKNGSVIDAYFIISNEGEYLCKFEFADGSNDILLTKNIDVNKENTNNKYTLVSFALDKEEMISYTKSKSTKVTVTKK